MPDAAHVVVVNTTPLVALSLVGQIDLLRLLYAQVLIPPAVQAEILAGGQAGIGVADLRRADWIRVAELRDPRRVDLLLTDLGAGRFLVEVITEKGEQLLALAPDVFETSGPVDKEASLAKVPRRFELEQVKSRLAGLFDDEAFWMGDSLPCLGCSACAFACPICSCFDLQDEASLAGGSRLRCWDACGQKLFTLHASGHNPRSKQTQRRRQRIMHKFSYMPERQSVLGCVGCGRCSRACPVDISLRETLEKIGGGQ